MSNLNLREQLLNRKPLYKLITVDNADGSKNEIEVRQVRAGVMVQLTEETDIALRTAKMIVASCFDPVTHAPIFAAEDVEVIQSMPFDPFFNELVGKINELSSLKTEIIVQGKD